VDLVHAHVPVTFARADKISGKFGRQRALRRLFAKSLHGSLLRREMRLPSDSKISI
jgi:hypothetical protein